MVQRLIDAVVSRDMRTFSGALVANVFITAAFVWALYFRNLHGDLTESRVTAFAEKRAFLDMLRMPYRDLRKKPLGHYLHLIDRDVDQITGLAFYDWIVFATNVIMVIAMLVYLIQCDWILSMVVVLVLPAFVFLSKALLPQVERSQEQAIAQQENLNDKVDECYCGNESIRAANAEDYFTKRFDRAILQWLQAKKAYVRHESKYDILSITGLMNIANMAIYCIGGWRVLNGKMTVGTITIFSLYFSTLWNSVDGFMAFFKEYRVKLISLSRLADLHSMCPENTKPMEEKLSPFEKITCDHIDFSYDDKPVLSDFSMEIKKGERVLITGENGSGKSTVARLMTGLLTPDHGKIYYNDRSLSEIGASALREKILLIPSEPFIIDGTPEENLWNETKGKLSQHLSFDKQIEKRGANLSNGQKKQLQLCRSLIADAEIIIFDEPFNFIDRSAKAAFWDEILKQFSDRTLIVISHDPFPGKDCNRVITMR